MSEPDSPPRLPAGLVAALVTTVLAVVVLAVALSSPDRAPARPSEGLPEWAVHFIVAGVLFSFLAVWIAVLIVFARDIRRRCPEQAALWCLVLLLGGILGLLLWLCARPPLPRD